MEQGKAPTERIRFGVFEIDLRAGELRKNGAKLKLQEQPFQILRVLLENPGEVVAREELRKRIWPADTFVDFDHGLYTAITKLREALRDSSENPRFIETLSRRGYRFIASVEEIAPRPQPPSKVIDSLAVLPFENRSGDPNTEYLSDGLAESLINILSQLPQLRVVPRGTVFRYKDGPIDARSLGRQLNVRAVLSGRVYQRGETINVQAELVDLANDSQLWGGQYDRKLSNVLAVQEEISREICKSLRLRLSAEDEKRLRKRYTQSGEAYQLYLKARYYWNKRAPEALQRAIDYFQQVLDKDPNYAPAHVGVADSYLMLSGYLCSAVPPKEAVPRALFAVAKALEIDPTLADAHVTLALAEETYEHDWSSAEKEFKLALVLNPNHATAHQRYAFFLTCVGRHEESIREIKLAMELDPLSLAINADAALLWYFARRYERAIEQCRRTLEMDSHFVLAHRYLARAYMRVARHVEAIAELEAAKALLADRTCILANLASAYGGLGRKEDARAILIQLNELSNCNFVPSYEIALAYASIGESDEALSWLEKAYEERSDYVCFVKVDPELDPLRSAPRLQNLLRRMSFPP